MSRFFTVSFTGIGRFAVRFRWVVVAAWIAAAVLAQHFFPSLASVANSSDASFLLASSPSVHAARLAVPFQGVGQTPVPVVIALGSPLDAADLGAVRRWRPAWDGSPACARSGTSASAATAGRCGYRCWPRSTWTPRDRRSSS